MRTPMVNVLAGLTIGVGVAVLVALASPPTVVGTAHAVAQVAVRPVGGVDVGDGPVACWVEKAHSAAMAEVICGNPALRPRTDTADIGEVFGVSATDCGWVASWAWRQGLDVAPAGCN